jgi:hypothetical protein
MTYHTPISYLGRVWCGVWTSPSTATGRRHAACPVRRLSALDGNGSLDASSPEPAVRDFLEVN